MNKSSITQVLPKQLNDAFWLATLENGSEEWLQLRQTGIGGSDIGAIVGVSQWTSPFALWARKTGKITDEQTSSEPMEWGSLLEPVILDKFEREHPELVVYRDVGTWYHKERPWQLANPDALAQHRETGEWFVVEIKTARYEDDWSEKSNTIPLSYRAQVLWYLNTFGFANAYVATLFSGSKYREFTVSGDEFEMRRNLARAIEFKGLVDDDAQPDFDGATSTLETIRRMHPLIDDFDIELGDLYVYYDLAARDFATAEAHFTEMKARVLDAMGNAKRGLFNDKVVLVRQARNGGTPYLVSKK